ncbi:MULTISPECIES: enoyl-CoA hydratase/isomerase family protein [Sorangium]|uniref:Enoyl-CoA hydratase n=1 Tax=Sorangium cellulosum TaxID=56 RepID=A0A4P2QJK0_SORCE|nr:MULTISPECIES: enoyl-CoA hydratase-related protein [Sorangium]AUX30197.1 enoyl-CoA hydratase [Sorangium cellulosum]WCQ89588.1 Short-chain-enoyl-CoA hydratase [Sorangium sp. Soce836]
MTAGATAVVQAASAGGVLRLTLNNPGRKNAIGPAMVNELLRALEAGMADAAVRCVVLTGAGDAFCAGGDFAQLTGAEGAPAPEPKGDYADLLLAMANASKPIVARVNGHALGGGLGLVAASHVAIAARGAKLGTPEIDVGLFPMMIMAVLQRHVSRRRLLEMMLLGQRLDADEAAQCGLLNRVVEPGALDAAVDEVTRAIAAKSPIAVRLGLEAFAAQDDLDLESALPLLRERLAGCLATDDAREGLMAFLEKRQPRWSGR